MRRPSRFTIREISRAIKAAEKAGAKMAVEILADGTIRLVPSDAARVIVPETNPWD